MIYLTKILENILDKVIITKLTDNDYNEIHPYLSSYFDKLEADNDWIENQIGHDYDKNLSIVAKIDNRVVGFYLLKSAKCPIQLEDVSGTNGLEGVALAVKKEYRGQNIGDKLVKYSQSLQGYDYIWGMQFKKLNNLKFWLKYRKVCYENEVMYITYQKL